MQDLNDLYFFAQVVDHGGFAPAGRALGVPKSTLSRRVAALEERLGVRLLQRTSRRFSVTELGADYYEHCKALGVEAEAAQAAIDRATSEPTGIVRVSCPITLLQAGVDRMLAEFMLQNPKVTLQLEASNRRVDVIAERVDVAIRALTPPFPDSELRLRVLAERAWRLVASPGLLAAHGTPTHPSELARFPSLAFGVPQDEPRWELQDAAGTRWTQAHTPRLLTGDMVALRAAALAGVGIVQLPSMILCDELLAGALVSLLPDWRAPSGVVHLVFPSRRGLLPSVRALIDFLTDAFAQLDEHGTFVRSRGAP
ncbi:MAG: LysR family transcriptional regulator [Myxococcales bacterium]|nr:LysR family transcriptional regulator [Myxococcales bacterium]